MCLLFALVFCVLLKNCNSHLMLYSAPHNEYMSTAVLTICIKFILFIYNVALYTMRDNVVLVGHNIVVPN